MISVFARPNLGSGEVIPSGCTVIVKSMESSGTACWPFCKGPMAEGIRAYDWSATPLGPIASWPQALTFTVAAMLDSRFPTLLAWGEERIGIYNDACIPLFGGRPNPLGRPFDEAWQEIWNDVRLVYESAHAGQPSYFEDLPLKLPRPDFPEQSWWTFSCSPVRDGTGRIGGVQATVLETTQRVVLQRRQALLLQVGDALRKLDDAGAITEAASALIGRHLGAYRVGYADIDLDAGTARTGRGWSRDGLPPRRGAYALDAFGPQLIRDLGAGRPIAVDDASADPRTAGQPVYEALGMRAMLMVPFVRQGRWVGTLGVSMAEPRAWTGEEIGLTTAVAERTWEAAERARVEASLRESHRRLDAALEAANMVAWDWDPESDRVTALGAVAKVFGLGAGGTIAKGADGFAQVHPDDLARHRDIVAQAAARREGYESEFRIVRRIDGETAWLEERARPREDPATGAVGLTGLVWDATRRKRAEIAREEARREVAEELAVVTTLHGWAVRVARPSEWSALLDEMLAAALAVLEADFGTIRLYDAAADTLTVIAHLGCDDDYLRRTEVVSAGDPALVWHRPMRGGRRVVFADIAAEPSPDHLREAAATYGFGALQITPLYDRTGSPVGALATGFRRPYAATEREWRLVDLYGAQIADVIGARQARSALAASEQRLRRLIEGIPQLVWRSWRGGRATWHSPQWFAFTGLDRARSLGHGWLDALHPDDRGKALAAWARADEIGVYDCEVRIRHERDGRYRWFQERAVAESVGGGDEWLGTSTDIDALRTLQEHQRALLTELQHRVRNTLWRLRSIVRASAGFDDGHGEGYFMRLDGRLDALVRAQGPVIRDPHAGVDLYELVANELTAQQAREGERATVSGPPVRLHPGAADILALALHELAVNAVEHGVLARPRGRVRVSWRIEDAGADGEGMGGEGMGEGIGGVPRLRLEWAETGAGPDRRGAPEREGYGFVLLNRTLPAELEARTAISFAGRGLTCVIDLPVTKVVLP